MFICMQKTTKPVTYIGINPYYVAIIVASFKICFFFLVVLKKSDHIMVSLLYDIP